MFDIVAEQIAKHAPEILMPWKRHERPGISDHADKAAQKARAGQCIQLRLNAFLLVQKPPGAPELNLGGNAIFMEIYGNGRKDVVIRGIGIVEDDLGKRCLFFKLRKVPGQAAPLRQIPDGVKTGAAADPGDHRQIHIAICAQMELLRPTLFGIKAAKVQHEESGEAIRF